MNDATITWKPRTNDTLFELTETRNLPTPDQTQTEADTVPTQHRLGEIAANILANKQQIEYSFLEIGRLLNEAKAVVPHGGWLSWLHHKVDFSESTAKRLIRLAQECENRSALADLGYTKASMLLRLPEPDRDTFIVNAHEVGGAEKEVADMSTRELEALVRKHNKARKGEANSSIGQEPEAKSIETKKAFHDKFEHLNLCIDSLLDYIANMNNDKETCNDLCAALRTFCKSTLSSLSDIQHNSRPNSL